MNNDIDKLALELYERAIDIFESMDDKNRAPLMQIIDDLFKEYGDRVASIIKKDILKKYNIVDEDTIKDEIIDKIYEKLEEDITLLTGGKHVVVFDGTKLTVNPSALIMPDVDLSKRLYENVAATKHIITKVVKEHVLFNKSINVLAKKLFTGYRPLDQASRDPLQMVITKIGKYNPMPHYLRKRKFERKMLRIANKVKTKPLKAAYRDLIKAIRNDEMNEYKKAYRRAYYEKMRFIAHRIAHTEMFRADNVINAVNYLGDEDIELVRYELSGSHHIKDECDYFAMRDFGYGKGIYPKDKMITLPLHPFCKCKYEPYYRRVKKRHVSDPDHYFKRLPYATQREILGGEVYAQMYHSQGVAPMEIFNAKIKSDAYKIREAVTVIPNDLKLVIKRAKEYAKRLQLGDQSNVKYDFTLDNVDLDTAIALNKWTDPDEFRMIKSCMINPDECENDDIKTYADRIMRMFDRYTPPTLSDDLYRGLSLSEDQFKRFLDAYESGDPFILDQYPSSWTNEYDVAKDFMTSGYEKQVLLIDGTVDKDYAYPISQFSDLPHENELLVAPNNTYIIDGIAEMRKNQYEIYVRRVIDEEI